MSYDLWTGFIKTHSHLSVQDLEDIQKMIELAEQEGYVKGLERGQEVMLNTQDNIMGLFRSQSLQAGQ